MRFRFLKGTERKDSCYNNRPVRTCQGREGTSAWTLQLGRRLEGQPRRWLTKQEAPQLSLVCALMWFMSFVCGVSHVLGIDADGMCCRAQVVTFVGWIYASVSEFEVINNRESFQFYFLSCGFAPGTWPASHRRTCTCKICGSFPWWEVVCSVSACWR
jgi:hypothetical protein